MVTDSATLGIACQLHDTGGEQTNIKKNDAIL